MVVCAAILATALANLSLGFDDGYVSLGGAPKLMKGHPTVRMADEFVRIDVQSKTIVVDVTFTFVNDGAATTVMMGFPDQYYFDQEEVEPFGSLKDFTSWVRGKKVPTRIVGEQYDCWHVKQVSFKKGETVKVRNRYLTNGTTSALNRSGYLRDVPYILETGASWRGPIGKAVVEITMRDGHRNGPVKIRQSKQIESETFSKKLNEYRPFFLCSGPSKATVKGNVIRFERRNFEPIDKDDIHIYYLLPSNVASEI